MTEERREDTCIGQLAELAALSMAGAIVQPGTTAVAEHYRYWNREGPTLI